jgi:nicotinic acid phosphoribosyltransferase
VQFITRTAAAGIAMNAWFLLGFVHTLLQHPELRSEVPFNTRLLTEQKAEKVFRAARAVLGSENFTLADFFRRCDRFTALSILRVLHEGDFVSPEHESAFKWDESHPSDTAAKLLPDSVTMEAVRCAIMDARLAAASDALSVGIDVNKFKAVFNLDDGTLDELDKDELDESKNDARGELTLPPPAEAVQICSAVLVRSCTVATDAR